jgi:glutamine phosphoribosylpyrophosphate amidotransferase
MRREPFGKNSLLGIWHRETNLGKYFQALLDKEKENKAKFEMGISTLRNEQIESIHTKNVETLLWYPLLGELSIASFRPVPIAPSEILHTMPPDTDAHLAVACIGTIQNISVLWEEIVYARNRVWASDAEETLACFIDVYLEKTDLPPVQIIHLLMERLRGRFVLMVLFALEEEELIIIAQCGYPLVFGRNNQTIFFGTDPDMLALFCPSIKPFDENVIVSCDSNDPSFRPDIFPYTG